MSKMYKVIVFNNEELKGINDSLEVVSSNLQSMKDEIESGIYDAKDVVNSYLECVTNELTYIKEKLKPDETWLS